MEEESSEELSVEEVGKLWEGVEEGREEEGVVSQATQDITIKKAIKIAQKPFKLSLLHKNQ